MTFHHRLSKRERIEQAIAFGRSFDWILTHLNVTVQDIDKTLKAWEVTIAEDDVEQPQRHSHRRPDCGSVAGYRWHRNHAEDVCRACRAASTEYEANRRRMRKAAA